MRFKNWISKCLMLLLVMAVVMTTLVMEKNGIAKASSPVINQDGMGYSGEISGLPLAGNISMNSYSFPDDIVVQGGNGAFASGVYDGSDIWLVPFNADKVVKINTATGARTSYGNWPLGFNKDGVDFVGGVFDGENIWMIPYRTDALIKLNTSSGTMTSYSLPENTGIQDRFYGGVFDGQNIWLVPSNSPLLVKVDKDTGATTTYGEWPQGFVKSSYAFSGGVFDGSNLWMIPQRADRVVKVDTATGAMTDYSNWPGGSFSRGSTTSFIGGVYAEGYVWLIPANASHVVKVDPSTGEMTSFDWPSGFTKETFAFAGGIYDGEHIWLVPGNADRVLKIDPQTGIMTGYDNWPSDFTKGTAAFRGGVYDGQSIWLVPANADRVVRLMGEVSSTISPKTANFDRYSGSVHYTDVIVTMNLNGNTLTDILLGGASIDAANYMVVGHDVTIKKKYLATLGTGTHVFTFDMNAGADPTLTVTVSDTTPQNSTLNPTTASFDKNTATPGYADVVTTLTPNGNVLTDILRDGTSIGAGNYTVVGNDVTMKKEYLATLGTGVQTFTFDVSAGVDPTLTVTVNHTPITANAANNSVTANPTSVTLGASSTLTATGDRQAANGTAIGDEKYVPVDWTSDDGATGTFSLNGSDYTSTYTPTGAGTHAVTAKFKKHTWNGTVWNDSDSSDIKTVSVTVNAPVNAETPSITTQPADQTVNVGGNATLNVAASVSDDGILSYQWYSNTSNSNSGGRAISGAETPTFAAPTTSAGTTYYYVEVTNTNNGATGSKTATATSNPAAVTVNSLTNAETPTITAQPADKTVNIGGNATLSVTASVSDGGTLSYQWYSNTTNSNSGGTAIGGADSSTHSAPTGTVGTTYYYVEVTNTNPSATGSQTATAASNPATVTVNRPAEPALKEIISVTNPESITGVANGTPKEADALGLPKTVEVTLDNGSKLDIDVKWDVESTDYNPKDKDKQNFTVTGELVKLPDGVYNSRNLGASVRVSVDAAAQGDIVGIENPGDITGLPNGTPKKAEALGLPEQVRVTLEDGTKRKVSVKWDVAGSDYDPAREEEQSFTVTGELVKLPEGITNSQKLKASVHVQVKAADDGGGDSRKIIKVAQPAPITGVENGTRKTAKALGLPKEVKVTLDDGSTLRVEVKWDVEDADYDPDSRKKQRFTVNGNLVDLPDDLENPENLGVSIRVTVDAVERDDDRDDRDNRRDRGKDDQSNDTKTRRGKIETGKHNDYSGSLLLEITRKTTAGGKQVDEVVFDKKKAKEIVEQAEEHNKDVIRITIDDLPNAPADEVLVKVPESTVELLQDRQVALEINTAGVIITIPKEAVANLPHKDLEFRIIPIRQPGEQQAVAQRTLNAEEVKQAAGGQSVLVVGKSIVIEANYSNRKTKVTFPLTDVQLPSDPNALRSYLSSLAVYVEHSDGDKELKSGEIRYDQQGKPEGIEIEVTKFSTFTVLSLQEKQEQVVHTAYMAGYPDGTFQPNRIMTRAEVAAVLATLMQEAGQEQTTETTAAFADVPTSHWAAKEIQQAHGAGLMMGDGSGLFHPYEKVTRAEMAAILVKMKKLSPQGKSVTFGDTQGHWAQASIAIAVEQGIMRGYADGSFRPNQGLTRAEAATLINRLTGRGPLTGITKAIWSDVPLTHWAFGEIAEATQSHKAMKLADGTERNINQQ